MGVTKIDWFAVDKKGLGQILERRGRSFAVLELISNGWDQNVTRVDVTLTALDQRAKYELIVDDDDPSGFTDISHAFTLFAPSEKKADATKRGRFNLGEKLVLALCDEAQIVSTTSAVRFDDTGRWPMRQRRAAGSEFRAKVHLTKADHAATVALIRSLLPPAGIVTTFNGEVVPVRQPVHEFVAQLPTEISDEEGNLRPTRRQTTIRLYEPGPDETASIYELGIPVVENGDRWHYDIGQKVPLNMDRDNVRPAYLRELRTLVLNEMHGRITVEDANATWAKEATEDPRVTGDALRSVLTRRFGERAVIYDPSDPEANNIAVSQGFTLIHGRQLSRDAWDNVKQHDLLKPAGQVTPSPSKRLNDLFADDGTKEIEVPEERWTDAQRVVVDYAQRLGQELLGTTVDVGIVSDITMHAAAYYSTGRLRFNVGRLGHAWFNNPDPVAIDALLIHEFAHHRATNHLHHSFHDECCRLGALLRDVGIRLGTPVAVPT